jgi:hypothetical protein
MREKLSQIDLVAVMIDGLHVGEHVILVALGIDSAGDKHVLGLYEGATENTTACKGLLADLERRDLCTERSILFVIDGSKALHSAIRAVFGERALIQRCQVHKRRNVEDHLPENLKLTIGRAITKAYRSRDAERAERILEGLARQLEREHPQAAASLREGLAETLTVTRMGLPEWLERTLATTNPIENLNGSIRRITRNVKRWDDFRIAADAALAFARPAQLKPGTLGGRRDAVSVGAAKFRARQAIGSMARVAPAVPQSGRSAGPWEGAATRAQARSGSGPVLPDGSPKEVRSSAPRAWAMETSIWLLSWGLLVQSRKRPVRILPPAPPAKT